MGEWQDISTIPYDGTPFLAFIQWAWADGKPACLADILAWDVWSNQWYSKTAPNYMQGLDRKCRITHWMPLPEPPQAEEIADKAADSPLHNSGGKHASA